MSDTNHPEISTIATKSYRAYNTPADLLADSAFPDTDKIAMLESWKTDLDNRLIAESEGMSMSDPMAARHEAKLADEFSAVSAALESIQA